MRVVIVGAGILGVTTAYFLQRHGCEVVVLDQHEGPAMGASQANGCFYSAGLSAPWSAPGAIGMAMRAQFDPTAAFRWQPDFSWWQIKWMFQSLRECRPTRFAVNRARLTRMALYAQACLAEVESDLRIDYSRSHDGVMQIYREAVPQAMVEAHLAYLEAMKVQARLMSRDEVFALEPALARSTPGLWGALHIPDDLSGDCEHFANALAREVQARGASFFWNAKVHRIHVDDARRSQGRILGLSTSAAHFKADAYVFATGVESASLLQGLVEVPVYPIKGYSITARICHPDSAPRHSMFDFAAKTGMARLGDQMRVSGIAEVVGHNLQVSQKRCDQLINTFEEAFPGAIDAESVSAWTGLRPATPDGVPRVSKTAFDNLFINTGHGGSGWSMSCGSGKLMADLVLGRTTDIDARDYALRKGD